MFQVKLLSEHATVPQRKSTDAAGYDLFAAYEYTVEPYGKELIDTDIAVAIPKDCYGRIAPRSGLAVKHSIDVGAGVIDSDYRGAVKVLLFNFGKDPVSIRRGDRVAQIILEKICTPQPEVVDELDDTERGSKGFGSSG